MSRIPRRRPGARALAGLAGALLLLAAAPPAVAAEGDGEEKPSDGAIAVSYTETTDVRPGAGWLIDCDAIEPLDGIEIACLPDGLTLTSLGFDVDLGEQVLTVRQSFGPTTIDVRHRVRLEPPPAPEVAVTRFDLPIAVGRQALIPISALGISCDLCTVDGGATIALGELPLGMRAGVSGTHLAVRGSFAGDVVLPLTVTDDAGQAVDVELTVSFVTAAAAPAAALHWVGDPAEISLLSPAVADGALVVCSPTQSLDLSCDEDGALQGGGTAPAQLLFHVVGADGALGWGSVTAADAGEPTTLAVPSWESEAPLSIVTVPPTGEQQPDVIVPLAGLAQLLEGIPAS